jgi:hypothetical protein
MSLVEGLFEELRQAIDRINELDHQTMKAKLDQHCTLFNYEKKASMKDTHLISRMELTLNYQTNKMNHSKFLNHGVFSLIGQLTAIGLPYCHTLSSMCMEHPTNYFA